MANISFHARKTVFTLFPELIDASSTSANENNVQCSTFSKLLHSIVL